MAGILAVGILLSVSIAMLPPVNADCKLPGNKHEDNSPSSKEGKQLIERGAGYCEIGKKCDAMEIDIAIDNKKELHETYLYQGAPDEVQKELNEYAEHGNGHDNPNIVCYELEQSIKESN